MKSRIQSKIKFNSNFNSHANWKCYSQKLDFDFIIFFSVCKVSKTCKIELQTFTGLESYLQELIGVLYLNIMQRYITHENSNTFIQ